MHSKKCYISSKKFVPKIQKYFMFAKKFILEILF